MLADFVAQQESGKVCALNHVNVDMCETYARAAVREALEKAEKKVSDHIAYLRTFRLARNTYIPAIVRELEQVAAAIAALRGKK